MKLLPLILNRPVLYGAAMMLCFAVGRYSVEFEVKEKIVKEKERETVTRTVVRYVKDPSGREETVTTIDEVEKERTKSQKETLSKPGPKINLSAMVGFEGSKFNTPIYGISASKELLGPISVGIFGMTNSTYGLTLGASF